MGQSTTAYPNHVYVLNMNKKGNCEVYFNFSNAENFEKFVGVLLAEKISCNIDFRGNSVGVHAEKV